MKNQFITRVFLSSLVLVLTSLFGGGNLLAQTDILTASKFTATSTGYSDFSNVKATSSAVYAGNSAKTKSGAIQLRSDKSISGIVTTASGGKVTKIVLEWESSTTAGRTIDVYGKSSAYTNAKDLYNKNTSIQGTLIGSIICGESTTLDVKDDYEYIGLRSRSGALYLNSVEITWASSSDNRTNPELAYGVSVYNATIGQKEGFPTLTHADDVTGITYSSSNKTVAEVDESGNVTLKGIEGTTTITASISNSQTWKDDEASYTLIVSKRSANLTYSASSCTVIVGETPELPTLSNPEGVEGIVYASSNTEVATVNETTGAVTLTGAEGTTVISATLTGHATFADGSASYTLTVTDKLLAQTVDMLTAELFTATSGYADFSDVKATSSAVYAGNSAKTKSGAIQLRSDNNNSGIVTTASGGKVTKIVLEWESSTTAGRTIDVYGKSSAYSNATDLYSESTRGTYIGSIKKGESTTLNVTGDYEYIGLRSSSKALYLNSVEITWASSGGSGGSEETTKKDPKLAYNPSSCTVIVGETPELPTLSNPEGVEGIVYASSNTEVATVNETTGAVTLTGAEGTTVISATFEGNATFANGSASYTLTVTKTNTYRYKKVTATEKLMDGGQYIIVCEDLNLAKGTGEGTGSVEVNINKGMIVPTESAALGVYTLEAMGGDYALKFGESDYLCSEGVKETGFSTSTTAVAWTVTIDENGNASIKCSDSPDRQILFSGTNCKNYASSNATLQNYYYVQLYQKVYPLTVSSATGGYATFYNEEEAYQMPEGLTGYAVTKAEAGDCITRKTAYEAGATVPAKTPLLIIGQADSYYPAVVSGTGVEAYAGSNLLEGKRDANGYTRSAKDGSVYYYKLGLNTKDEPGFYWGAENGAAFQMKKATTAYLAVPQKLVEGANALFFDFGSETGINEIQTEQADKAIFDLSGRRVQKATKGFYIVGGKKVLVK